MSNNITPMQAFEWLSSGEALLIDVREPDEFKAEHIVYALSLPLGVVGNISDHLKIPKDRKVIFQCLKGARGKQACDIASNNVLSGYEIYNIDGGIDAWKAQSLPIISPSSGAGLSIFRQVQIIVGLLILAFILLGFAGIAIGFVIAGVFAGALAFAGVTGFCGLAMLLNKMPWNR